MDYHGWRNWYFEYVKRNKKRDAGFAFFIHQRLFMCLQRIVEEYWWRACLSASNRHKYGDCPVPCLYVSFKYVWRMRLSTSILGLFQMVNYVVRSWVRRTKQEWGLHTVIWKQEFNFRPSHPRRTNMYIPNHARSPTNNSTIQTFTQTGP